MKPETNLPSDLSLDIIIQIFLWLPVMSLMRFRCVSKFFNTLVLDDNFIYVHHQRSMIRDGGTKLLMANIEDFYDVELNKDGKISRWNFNGHAKYFSGRCVNGVYCMWNATKESVRIFNPSTRKIIRLPCRRRKITHSSYNYSLGYEPIEKKYKVLMNVANSRGRIGNFIFTLSMDKSWRKVKNTIKYFPHYSTRSCSIEGAIYMLDFAIKSIVAFDLRVENFRIIRLGNEISDNILKYSLIEVKGKVALLDRVGCFSGQSDLWILENVEAEEWKGHSICVPLEWKEHVNNIPKPINFSFTGLCNFRAGEIIFTASRNDDSLDCYFYNVEKNNWRHLKIHEIPTMSRLDSINIYVESLYLS